MAHANSQSAAVRTSARGMELALRREMKAYRFVFLAAAAAAGCSGWATSTNPSAASGTSTLNGSCANSSSGAGESGSPCPAGGQIRCSCGTCIDGQSDSNNCGICGYACAPGHSCVGGSCVSTLGASGDGAMGAEGGSDAGEPPSCAPGGPGMTDCGAGDAGTETCCTSLEVSGGAYYRNYDLYNFYATAVVSSFRLDKGRFRQFVNAVDAGWLPAQGAGKHTHLNGGLGLVGLGQDGGLVHEPGWVASDDSAIAPTNANLACAGYPLQSPSGTWTSSVGSNESLPINCVTWQEAYAFCIWDGGFLQSDAEREYAAAGGSQQRLYPWGSTDPGSDNQYAIYGCYYPAGASDAAASPSCGEANIAPVGTAALGAGRWGQLDLAGEVWEWALDWAASPYGYEFGDPFPASSVSDFVNLQPSWPGSVPGRIVRGADFTLGLVNGRSPLSPGYSGLGVPTDRGAVFGFRCARTP
jgi:sulfatase modifying factor 1